MYATAEKIENFETLRQANHEVDSPRAIYDDATTWLAEVLDGQMRTEFRFEFNGTDLVGEDGRILGEIFDNSIADAEIIAQKNPALAFELRRRKLEKLEYNDMVAMMNSELPNTMIVISDFPPELVNSSQDIGGYNVRRKQTMMRVITKQPDGSLLIQTQSLDGSNRFGLEAIYDSLAVVPEAGELLGQRIHLDVPGVWQNELINNLTKKYDQKLQDLYGGQWYGGRKPANMQNTYEFVSAQADLINIFVAKSLNDPGKAENMRFNLAAAIEARFNKRNQKYLSHNNSGSSLLQPLMMEMQLAGQKAKEEGRSFSGCGLTVGIENSSSENLADAGYGNKSSEDKYGSLEFKCQKGHVNTRPRNKLIPRCKTCGISVKC